VDAALTVDLVACDKETNGLWPEIDPVTRIHQTMYSRNWVYNKFPASILPAKAFTEGWNNKRGGIMSSRNQWLALRTAQ